MYNIYASKYKCVLFWSLMKEKNAEFSEDTRLDLGCET